MYEQYFHLKENPFTIAPNPRYFYLSDKHREALAHLQYGLGENGGFILLTGEVGTGKTTAWRCLVESLPSDIDLAVVLNPRMNEIELLETICDELGIVYQPGDGIKRLTDALNHHLLETHARRRRTVLIVEEAQNLELPVLEQLRLLTNLETNEHKLLQIILVGQPELLDKISDYQLRQLRQRIVARFHLTPLTDKEVRAYIAHRLAVAGAHPHLYSESAVRQIIKSAKGIPRLVNLICDRALLGGFSEERRQIDARIVRYAVAEVFGERDRSLRRATKRLQSLFGTSPYRVAWASSLVIALTAGAIVLEPPEQLMTRISTAFYFDKSPQQTQPTMVAEQPQATQAITEQPLENQPVVWQDRLALIARKHDPYRTLFNLWGVSLPELLGQSPCEYALEHQLDCWHRRGGLTSLKRINRPALLKMIATNGQLFYAVLQEIGQNNRLKLTIANQSITIAENELDEVWTREYTLLWQRPENYRDTVYPGDRDDTMPWITKQLANLPEYGPPLAESLSYNFDLEQRVRLLQERCGLFVDGLVGKETLIKINTLVSTPPKLKAGAGCRSGVS